MRVRIFQLDAFTTRRFAGNPAAVMLLNDYPADAVLQTVAAENNLPETAFLVRQGEDYRLRWFTPTVEVPLCGHATLVVRCRGHGAPRAWSQTRHLPVG